MGLWKKNSSHQTFVTAKITKRWSLAAGSCMDGKATVRWDPVSVAPKALLAKSSPPKKEVMGSAWVRQGGSWDSEPVLTPRLLASCFQCWPARPHSSHEAPRSSHEASHWRSSKDRSKGQGNGAKSRGMWAASRL